MRDQYDGNALVKGVSSKIEENTQNACFMLIKYAFDLIYSYLRKCRLNSKSITIHTEHIAQYHSHIILRFI